MSVLIITKLPDGSAVQGAFRPIHTWAWMHTLRTGNEPENMQQVLEWAHEEMLKVNISEQVIDEMITDEINHIMAKYENQLGPKQQHEIEMNHEPPEIA